MNSNCQIREKSLYLKWCSLCASLPARQFIFPQMKTCMCPLPLTPLPYPPDAVLMESVGVWQTLMDGKLAFMALRGSS